MSASFRVKTWVGVVVIAASARLADIALVGSGLATAAASIAFAGAMLMQGDHPPSVNGLEYLAIFARPRAAAKPPVVPATRPPIEAANAPVDTTPVGSIGVIAPGGATGYAIVAAQPDFAWVRDGARVFAVRPGDILQRLGRVSAITRRDGRWTLLGDSGAALLSGVDPSPRPDQGGHSPAG